MSFDNKAVDWDNDPVKTERAIAFAKDIINNLPSTKSLNALEFGCGTGLLSFQLNDRFRHIDLIDNSVEMINVLNRKITENDINNFSAFYIQDYKSELKKFNPDIVYTMMALHHIIDIEEIIKIFHSIIESNGYLCIADLDKEDGSFHGFSPDFDGYNGFDRGGLQLLLQHIGFEIIYDEISFTIHKESNNRNYPLFLMIAQKKP